MLPGQLKTYLKCVYALMNELSNELICITNNECLILHHKAKIRARRREILVLREF